MSNGSYTADLLVAAKLAAIAEDDELLAYLIAMAIERAKALEAQRGYLKTA